jgi:hypothetical protein
MFTKRRPPRNRYRRATLGPLARRFRRAVGRTGVVAARPQQRSRHRRRPLRVPMGSPTPASRPLQPKPRQRPNIRRTVSHPPNVARPGHTYGAVWVNVHGQVDAPSGERPRARAVNGLDVHDYPVHRHAPLFTDMPQRYPRLIVLLLFGLTAMALSVAAHAVSEGGSPRDKVGAAFTSQGAGVDSSMARLTGKDRSGGAASQRLLTQRSVLLAIATLLVLPLPGRRRTVTVAPLGAWTRRGGSRAPAVRHPCSPTPDPLMGAGFVPAEWEGPHMSSASRWRAVAALTASSAGAPVGGHVCGGVLLCLLRP